MRRPRKSSTAFRGLIAILLFTVSATSQSRPFDAGIKRALVGKYPGEHVIDWCGGAFLGKPQASVVALHNPTKKQFHVVWVEQAGLRELQSVLEFGDPARFELQCLDARKAKALKQTLRHSEAIHDFLHVPAGKGALCYFVEPTETKCWSLDRKGSMVDAGGWQT